MTREGVVGGVEQLDALVEHFATMTANAEALAANPPNSLESLFPDAFMVEYTTSRTFRGFLDASPWWIESRADFDEIPEREFDTYVQGETAFDSWDAMLDTASRQWFFSQVED